MIKTFPITFIQEILRQKLYEQHLKDSYLFGGDDQIIITSFYEQLKSQEQVDRFVEAYRDLTEQQNRLNLIGNAVLVSPENPTITNLYTNTIIPMTWTCSMRVRLEDRDEMLVTINNLIHELKGRKVDVAQLECVDENGKKYYQPFCVGTAGEDVVNNKPAIVNGDFIGKASGDGSAGIQNCIYINFLPNNFVDTAEWVYFQQYNDNIIKVAKKVNDTHKLETINITSIGYSSTLVGFDISFTTTETYTELPSSSDFNISVNVTVTDGTREVTTTLTTLYGITSFSLDASGHIVGTGHMSVFVGSEWDSETTTGEINEAEYYIKGKKKYIEQEDDGNQGNIIFPPNHTNFEKYKVSLSFESIRCDEPRTLNGDEYCEISFGGSATIVDEAVFLGNDLLKVDIKQYKLIAETPIDYSSSAVDHWLEPLELPSGSNANTVMSQLMSNNFKQNTHTDGIAISRQYTFIVNRDSLIQGWFRQARDGTFGYTVESGITRSLTYPNIIYKVRELWNSWANVYSEEVLAKVVESIDVENTESDTLTITVPLQIQGENY